MLVFVKPGRAFLFTTLAMIAFAGNSLLCRLALQQTQIDAASFTFIRIVSGAIVLGLIARARSGAASKAGGSWTSALALFGYAAAFSFAYLGLSTGTGALLLFGAVQATMILWGLHKGERLRAWQILGLILALTGLVALVFPGLSAPPPGATLLMLSAGVAWGIYSLRGRAAGDPINSTAGNFLRAVPLAALLSLAFLPWAQCDRAGITFAIFSGAIASGLGYAIWYTALPALPAAVAATVQLSVPIIAAAGGILFLGETLTPRLVLAACAVLGGIVLVVSGKERPPFRAH